MTTILGPATTPAQEGREFYVSGDVPRPGAYSLAGRTITAKQALASAGFNLTQPAIISVIRRNSAGGEEQFLLNAGSAWREPRPMCTCNPTTS